jgi:hypothetical protein
MHPAVVTKDPAAVAVELKSAFSSIFPGGDGAFIVDYFRWAEDCFAGKYKDYQAVDAPYHDFEHTLQGTLCMARLLVGRHRAGVPPGLTVRMFQLGLLAILLHDMGYLKKRKDSQGTGAKYTVIHVSRSAAFAAELLGERGFGAEDIKAVQNMIHCTGVDAVLDAIRLLGQMAAADYVEKLPLLHAEFAEAARFSSDTTHFASNYSSAKDLMQRTPAFWDGFVLSKLNHEFGGLYRFLNDPYPDGPNPYLEWIEANMDRLRKRMAAPTGA